MLNKKFASIFALVGAVLIGTLTSCGGGSGEGPGRDKIQKIKFLHISPINLPYFS